jgi:hypothetical protein
MTARRRMIVLLGALALAIQAFAPAAAQDSPAELATKAGAPAAPEGWSVPRTPWGDPDLRGTWPLENLATRPERPPELGDKAYWTDEEYAAQLQQAQQGNERYAAESGADKIGAGHWTEAGRPLKQTSLILEPANGRYPPLTEEGERRRDAMRSSWTREEFDTLADFNTLDRCLSRGLPTSMTPFPYNNGLRIFQAPGYVVIQLELIHETRIIPLDGRPGIPDNLRTYLGESRGHWEGGTLVIETTNLTGETSTNLVGPAGVSVPSSPQQTVVERLTLVGPETILYDAVVTDPGVFTAPFRIVYPWARDDDYQMFEYACHEGNTIVRNYIRATSPRFAEERAAAFAEPASEGR